MIEIVKPSWEWLRKPMRSEINRHLERCGRVCYRSEAAITDGSARKFVKKICKLGHESVLEHESLTARVICSRAASHQLVRHRLGAYSQESMRYCNYGKSEALQVICPPSIGIAPGKYINGVSYGLESIQYHWLETVAHTHAEYLYELDNGIRPEDARFVLPNATKTEVVCTYNLRMWRHVIKERGLNPKAQWEIRDIFFDIYEDLKLRLPEIFGDLDA